MEMYHDKRNPGWSAVLNRVAAALLGGYAFTWGFSAFSIAGLVSMGVEFHQASTGVMILAFLLYLFLFLWAFAAPSLMRVWTVLVAGGAAMTIAAWALQRSLIG